MNQKKKILWLNLKSDKGGMDQILIGFSENATSGVDKGYDALKMPFSNNPLRFYSIINNNKFVIQGLNSFIDETYINLGFDLSLYPRVLSIEIDKTDGILNEAQIYLKDNLTNMIHDLTVSPYEFDYNSISDQENRFTLVLARQGAVLDIDEEQLSNEFFVTLNQRNIHITSKKKVENIKIYDILGKMLLNSNPKKEEFELQTNHFTPGNILIINAIMQDGSVISKKIIN